MLRIALPIALAGLLALLAVPPAVAQLTSTVTVAGQEVAIATPAALVDAKAGRISILFPHAAIPANLVAAARSAGSWEGVAAKVGPGVIADLLFTPGSRSGLFQDLRGCSLTAVGFRAQWSRTGTTPADCHAMTVAGVLEPGTGYISFFQGQGKGYALTLTF